MTLYHEALRDYLNREVPKWRRLTATQLEQVLREHWDAKRFTYLTGASRHNMRTAVLVGTVYFATITRRT